MAGFKYPIGSPDDAKFEAANPHMAGFIYVIKNMDKETDRGMVLILAGFLEEALLNCILAFFVDGTDRKTIAEGPGAPIGTLSSRITMSHALGLITPEDFKDLGLVRVIRNDFAHQPGASFSVPAIQSRCREFTKITAEVIEARDQYKFACIGLIIILMRRTALFARERRKPLDPKYGDTWEDAPEGVPFDAVRLT